MIGPRGVESKPLFKKTYFMESNTIVSTWLSCCGCSVLFHNMLIGALTTIGFAEWFSVKRIIHG
jgi:hypothetical protein